MTITTNFISTAKTKRNGTIPYCTQLLNIIQTSTFGNLGFGLLNTSFDQRFYRTREVLHKEAGFCLLGAIADSNDKYRV